MEPVELLSTYLAMDRRHALAVDTPLPDSGEVCLLFADIAGFTPLTERLVATHGPQRGAEELAALLNGVYSRLVDCVHRFRGSVVCFIGDALIACFANDPGRRATASALAMQEAMQAIRSDQKGGDVVEIPLALKAAVAAGPVRRFLVGDPRIFRHDLLAGSLLDRLSALEHVARPGELLVTEELGSALHPDLTISRPRPGCAVVSGLPSAVTACPWEPLPADVFRPETLKPYLLEPVFDRVMAGHGDYLAELRPIVSLFLRFEGVDYDEDADAGDKLDAFTRWVQGVVAHYGGHVPLITTGDKGSHLYAVFGALEAHEDDSERAVAAARELVVPPDELVFVTDLRIGLARGRARVGAYGGTGRRTYGALGEPVNRAARLMTLAGPGEIRCDRSIVDAAGRRWRFDALPAAKLKGIRGAVEVFRPIATASETRAATAEQALVGRADERASLASCLASLEAGRQLLLVEGEPGIGKSRLVDELCHMAEGMRISCALGAGDSMEQRAPYRAWRDLLLGLLGVAVDQDPSLQRASAAAWIDAVGGGTATRLPLLNDVLGLGFPETGLTRGLDPKSRHEALAAFLAELLRGRALNGPLVLIFEDAHWMDSLSWELLLSSARALAECPVLLVVTHRAPQHEAESPLAALSALEGVTTLRLERLPDEETVAVAAMQLGLKQASLPREVASLVARRSEGNPLFARELIGALREQGRIEVRDGRCAVVGDVASLGEGLPESLEGVVLSRLDRIPADRRLTAKVASVVGRSFLLKTVCDVHPGPLGAESVEAHILDLVQRRLTVLEASEPEPRYAFEHIIIQQVVYGTLLFEQRREIHRRVAEWFEETHGDNLEPFLPLLVIHWAGANDADKELDYCTRAGCQAASRYANEEALIYLSRALDLARSREDGGDAAQLFRLLRHRVGVSVVLGRVVDERHDLEAMSAIADTLDDPCAVAGVGLLWSDFHCRGGRFAEAVEGAEQARQQMQRLGDVRGEAEALVRLGSALEGQGQFDAAGERLESALERFRSIEDAGGQANCLKTLGVIQARRGQFPAAMERFRGAGELYSRIENGRGEAEILGNLGALSYYLGQYERSIEHTERAKALFRDMGNRAGTAKCLTNIANCWNALGDFSRGLEFHKQALDLYGSLEDSSGFADGLCNLGIAHEALGVGGQPELVLRPRGKTQELAEAAECYAQALALYRRIGSERGEVGCEFNLGSTELCLGNVDEAEEHLARAIGQSRRLELRRLEMRCHAALARCALAVDEPDRALEHSSRALELLGDASLPEADEVQFACAHALLAVDRGPEAVPLLDRAQRSVHERAERIEDEAVRAGFLRAYGAILSAWEEYGEPTSPGGEEPAAK